MAALNPEKLPDFVFSNTELSAQIHQLTESKHLIKVGSKLYIRRPKVKDEQLEDAIKLVINQNFWAIVSNLVPGAIIVDRTAIENRAAEDGSICIVSDRMANYQLPGLVIRPRPGHGPIPDEDLAFVGNLFISCPGRAYLENLLPTRARNSVRRTLPLSELESRLDRDLRIHGQDAVNKIRDQASRIAPQLGLEEEFTQLDGMIGSLLGTRKVTLYSEVGKARLRSRGFDPERNQLLTTLWHVLSTHPKLPDLPERPEVLDAVLPFYDAYFSNFIEGTKFKVSEAEAIIFQHQIPVTRPADAHDILGTYRIVSSQEEMARIPENFGDFVSILKERHSIIMSGRPETQPGEFKEDANQAGNTVFVPPDLVMGTLEKGFDLYTKLTKPFARAVFMHFLVSEVHPFNDGNGRISRIMLNAELVYAKEQKIIIPQVYRTEYVSTLKSLTNNGNAEPMIRVMTNAQQYTSEVDFSNLTVALDVLTKTQAFQDPADALGNGGRLTLPSLLGLPLPSASPDLA
jgi:hypothetical protein